LDAFSRKLLENYPINCKGLQRIEFLDENISLTLFFGEVISCLKDLDPELVCFDACFHDGFAPQRNKQMWSPDVFHYLSNLSHDKTTYATFSSSKIVIDGLMQNGFRVQKNKGFGNKRHMTKATRSKKSSKKKFSRKKEVGIIGAGIAGSTLAKKLIDKGHRVTIFEKNDGVNKGASNFEALVVYPRLSAFNTPYSLFCLHSYLYSTKYYDALETSNWNKTGVLLLDFDESTNKRFNALLNARQDEKIFQKVSKKEASNLAGISVPAGGLYFKEAGWLNPETYIKELLNNPDINFVPREVTRISKTKVFLEDREYSFDHICLCSSFESNKLIKLKGIKKKRGQVTYLSKDSDIASLKIPICAESYISPTSKEFLITGSTYSDSYIDKTTLEDDLENIQKLQLITDQKVKVLDSDFGYRSTTQDHLPLVGKSNDIFINICHGSRGTTSAPISAQFICDLIEGSPPIFGIEMIKSLNPERFTK